MPAAKPGHMEREEGTPAGNSKMPDGKGPAGILDDTVRTAAERAASGLFGIGKEKLHGVGMVDNAVDRNFRGELDQFVSDLFGHNC